MALVRNNVHVAVQTDSAIAVMRHRGTMPNKRLGLPTTASFGIQTITTTIGNDNRMHNRRRTTTSIVHNMGPFVAPISRTVTTAAVAAMATNTRRGGITITDLRGGITMNNSHFLADSPSIQSAYMRRNTAEPTQAGNHTATTCRMADIRSNDLQSTGHTNDFMAVVKEVVIQQLSARITDRSELSELSTRIRNRLVLNLSTVTLSPDQLSLLQLGIGFRPNSTSLSQSPEENAHAAEHVVRKLGFALQTTMWESRDACERLPGAHMRSADTSHSGSSTRNLSRSLSAAFKRFRSALQDNESSVLSDLDIVSAHQLNGFKNALLRELQNADGKVLRNLSAGQETALLQLRRLVSKRQIVVRKADKSRQVCILDPDKYDQAVTAQLSDTSTYLSIPFNLNRKCAALIKQCVRKFVTKKLLTDKQAHALLLYTDEPASRYFYGLPKTHKPTTKWKDGMPPLRPICPDLHTETAASGCFIARYLDPLLRGIKSYCKNSYDLKDRLLGMPQLGPDMVLLTADVDSLYPSIPIGPALHRVVRKLDNKAPEFQLVVQLLRIQLAHNYFCFKDKSFQQIRGLPMGKAWAPVVACIYMDDWECSLWSVLGFEPVVYVRYIDDIFAVFNNRAEAERFLMIAGGHDSNIKLSETNIGRSVHFLDLQISLNDRGGFDTSVYRKDSDLIVLLHRKSAHKTSVKDGVILSQLRRFLRLHTNYTEAGRCMYVFMHLMIQLRGLTSRRARFLWSSFINKIRSGAIPLAHQSPRNDADESTLRFVRSVHIPIPALVRWKRIRLILSQFLDQLNAQQRASLRNIMLYSIAPLPLGVALFRR